MEYVEVRGKSVDVAVAAALEELGIDRERAEIEIIQEPERGFLGMGGKDAIVRVKERPQPRRRRRRRRGGESEEARPSRSGGRRSEPQGEGRPASGRPRDSGRDGGRGGKGRGGDRSGQGQHQQQSARAGGGGSTRASKSDRDGGSKEDHVSIDEQAPVVEAFLKGLVESFGLEGDVTVRTEEDVIVADVSGPQTEAMVGPRGSTIEAIHELTKTVLQRKTQSSARLRLDVAGYAERRRQALSIYAGQLIDQVLEEGGEVMLEPMSAGDRKTIHDAVAAREGVRSYSEGEAPQRYVVIAVAGDSDEEE